MNGLMTIPHLVDKHHPTISDFFMYSQLQMAWSPPLIADPTKCPQWYPLYESPCQVMSDPTLWLWHTDTPPNIDIIPIYIICLYNIYIHIILSYIYSYICPKLFHPWEPPNADRPSQQHGPQPSLLLDGPPKAQRWKANQRGTRNPANMDREL